MTRNILAAFAVAAALALTGCNAHAQSPAPVAPPHAIVTTTPPPTYDTPTVTTTTTSSIDYGQAFGFLQPYVIALVSTIFSAAGAWIVFLVQKYTGIKINQAQADTYLRAAKNQASSLIADGFVEIAKNGKVTVNNPALAAAANDLIAAVPDAVSHFALNNSPDEVAKKIVDMIPQVPATPAVVAATAAVAVNPVPPPRAAA